jgi:hypothetical protein
LIEKRLALPGRHLFFQSFQPLIGDRVGGEKSEAWLRVPKIVKKAADSALFIPKKMTAGMVWL